MESDFSQWVEKAEHDWEAVNVLFRSRKSLHDIILFHCHQVAEKYLKAFLVYRNIAFKKSHDLVYLLHLVEKEIPTVSNLHNDVNFLNDFAIEPRYPGDIIQYTPELVQEARLTTKRIRNYFRKTIGAANKKKTKE